MGKEDVIILSGPSRLPYRRLHLINEESSEDLYVIL